jgi:hypothetical protein
MALSVTTLSGTALSVPGRFAGPAPAAAAPSPSVVASLTASRDPAIPARPTAATLGVAAVWPTDPLPVEGSFVTAAGHVWRLVGRALVLVPTWAPYGGRHRTVALTARQYEEVRYTHVRDGTFLRSIPDGGIYTAVGGAPVYVSSWAAVGGRHPWVDVAATVIAHAVDPDLQGETQWHALRAWVGFDHSYQDPDHFYGPEAGAYVPHFVRSGADGRVYVLAGGAPVYLTSWAVFGGPRRVVTVDQAALDHAGQGNRWRFLRWSPSGLLSAAARPGARATRYSVAGGAPIYLPDFANWPIYPGEAAPPAYPVDPAAIALAGTGGPYDHLRLRPTDGTFLRAYRDPDPAHLSFPYDLYWVSGGAPVPVHDAARCAALGLGGGAFVDVRDIIHAGGGGAWDHLAAAPVPAPAPPC